jgi:hypothetical protein
VAISNESARKFDSNIFSLHDLGATHVLTRHHASHPPIVELD